MGKKNKKHTKKNQSNKKPATAKAPAEQIKDVTVGTTAKQDKLNMATATTTETKKTTTPQITEEAVNEMVGKAGYPDISKANTKTVIIWSLVVVIIILLLSVLIPPSTLKNGTTETTTTQPCAEDNAGQSTKTTTEEVLSTTESSSADSQQPATEETTESSEPALLDMGLMETSVTMEVFSMPKFAKAESGFQTINGKTYYLQKGEIPFTGWLNINNICYYIQDDGTIATGWQEIDGVTYCFADNGIMLTNQWIDGKYVGTEGNMYANTITPDGTYVGKDGLEDISLGKTNSVEGMDDLKVTLEEMLSGYSGTWSIYVKDIENNKYLTINNTQLFSASLIKLYCAAAAYDLMERGELEGTERILSLMAQMISISDNDAFNLMVAECSGTNSQVAGRPIIQSYIDAEGYKDTTITSMLLPTKYRSPSSPGRNYTTVEDCGLLLEKIYKGKCVNPEVSRNFLDLLLHQTHINKIPAGLPEGTKCANKTGDTNQVQHDAAIVYSLGGDYILSIMSTDCGSAIINSQKISETVYEYFN